MTKMSVTGVKAVAVKALQSGGETTGAVSTAWDLAGKCQNPIGRTLEGRPFRASTINKVFVSDDGWGVLNGPQRVTYGPQTPYHVDLTVKCRRCPQCLKERAYEWRCRMAEEIRLSSRTWHCTFTLSPHGHEIMANRARVICHHRRREDFEQMSESEQFIARNRMIQAEFTLMLKRMRRGIAGVSGRRNKGLVRNRTMHRMKFRYVLVLEKHKSGLPHYHMLIHEFRDNIRYAQLKGLWCFGFSSFKLVDEGEKAAFYVAKYLGKSNLARVRASIDYGKPPRLIALA